jgi:hypothetical protein
MHKSTNVDYGSEVKLSTWNEQTCLRNAGGAALHEARAGDYLCETVYKAVISPRSIGVTPVTLSTAQPCTKGTRGSGGMVRLIRISRCVGLYPKIGIHHAYNRHSSRLGWSIAYRSSKRRQENGKKWPPDRHFPGAGDRGNSAHGRQSSCFFFLMVV